jgi:chemotaxis protein histidine kinase CheA
MELSALLLTVYTRRYRYLVRREQVASIYALAIGPTLNAAKPTLFRDLGPLVANDDQPTEGRCHVVLVHLRRRSVAFLVERVDDMQQLLTSAIRPLAPLLARNLRRGWVSGTYLDNNEPLLVLDLEQIARDVALGL